MAGGNHRRPGRVTSRIATCVIGGALATHGLPGWAETVELPAEPNDEAVAQATDAPSDEKTSSGAWAPIAGVADYDIELIPDPADPVPPAPKAPAPKAPAPQATPAEVGTDPQVAVAVHEQSEIETAAPETASEDLTAAADTNVETPAASTVEKPRTEAALRAETASFFGATPGATTRQELLAAWGKPADGDAESVTIVYELESFPHVAVGFAGDVVDSIEVHLAMPRATEELVEILGLDRLQPTFSESEQGERLVTIFPERGVSLRHFDVDAMAMAADDETSLDSPEVYSLVVHALRAEQFVQRAERQPPYAFGKRIADLEAAVLLEPDHADAHHLLAGLKLAAGQPAAAERHAATAVELGDNVPAFRLQWVETLTALARYDQAVEQCRQVLDSEERSPLVRARALHQMGVLASFGSTEVAERSVPLHTRAIELADALASDEDPAVAAAAGELLVEAHLAVASSVARGEWGEKDAYVAQWIGRASALAEHLIEQDRAYLPLRIKVASQALAAGNKLQPPIDPQLWVAEAEETVGQLAPVAELDQLARDQFNWSLGVAYYYAAEIQHRRGQAASALRYGQLAETQLVDLVAGRDEEPDASYLLGRLYFQIGAVHAVHREDHEKACQWYDKAREHLMKQAPVTNLAAPGRHGDALVSMGVSYWHTGQRERAVELTEKGLRLAEQGIRDGLLAETATTVAQGNLTAMQRALGQTDAAGSRTRSRVAGRPTGRSVR